MRGFAPALLRLAALALAAAPAVACGAEPAPAAQKVAPPLALTGRVVDAANVLPPEIEAGLAARSEALEKATGVQFVVVSTPSLGGRDIGEYATALGNGWNLGAAHRGDGLILLIAPNDRKLRISTSQSFGRTLTDAECQKVAEIVLENFRKGDMAGGVVLGAGLLDRLVRVKMGVKA